MLFTCINTLYMQTHMANGYVFFVSLNLLQEYVLESAASTLTEGW